MKRKYTIRKYDGDDRYSWAVFRNSDLPKCHQGVVLYGEATPVVSGLDQGQAQSYRRVLEVEGNG
mgnify:CR=1 FL=1